MLMILLGAVIGWPVKLSGFRRWVGLALAATLGAAAFYMLITHRNLEGTILCLLAQMEWVGAGSKPVPLRDLFKRNAS